MRCTIRWILSARSVVFVVIEEMVMVAVLTLDSAITCRLQTFLTTFSQRSSSDCQGTKAQVPMVMYNHDVDDMSGR